MIQLKILTEKTELIILKFVFVVIAVVVCLFVFSHLSNKKILFFYVKMGEISAKG